MSWQVVFSADEAVRRCKDGDKVILVRIETSPDDIHGLHAAEGVLTTRGGEEERIWDGFEDVFLKDEIRNNYEAKNLLNIFPNLTYCWMYVRMKPNKSIFPGGMTSHAAVVARGMGRPCVAGAGGITVDYAAQKLTVGHVTVTEGQILTIDGSTGEVMLGEVPTESWNNLWYIWDFWKCWMDVILLIFSIEVVVHFFCLKEDVF